MQMLLHMVVLLQVKLGHGEIEKEEEQCMLVASQRQQILPLLFLRPQPHHDLIQVLIGVLGFQDF
jgi:hypothetical protein